MNNSDKIVVTTIFIVLLLCAYAVSGAQAANTLCVDCDLNKKAFKKNGTVLVSSNEIEPNNVKHVNTYIDQESKILYNNVREVKNDTEQYCFVKIVIKEKDGVVSKEEELYCSDGRKGIDTPSYWELFAQFYYRDIPTPES